MFPFSHGNLEFQAMVAAGMSPARALRAATGTAAELLGRTDIGRLEPGKAADIVAMPGNPLADISVTAAVDFVMRAGWIHCLPQRRRPHPETMPGTTGLSDQTARHYDGLVLAGTPAVILRASVTNGLISVPIVRTTDSEASAPAGRRRSEHNER